MVGLFAKVGKDLGKATDAYNKAVSSWEGRLPQARRLEDMQISDNTAAQLEDLPSVDMALKAPTATEDETISRSSQSRRACRAR